MRNFLNSLVCLLVLSNLIFGVAYEDVEIDPYGEINYSSQDSQKFSTTLKTDFKVKLLEPSHERWGLFLTGNVSPDYDVFQKILKINTFQALSLEF